MRTRTFTINPLFAAAISFFSLLFLLFFNSSAHALISVQSLVTEGQGVLPNSGPLEIFGINVAKEWKYESTVSGDGYLASISLSYTQYDPDELWWIKCIGIESVSDGVPGTIRFAVARTRKEYIPPSGVFPPITDPIWQRQVNPACDPPPPNIPPLYCETWYYLDARVGPAEGIGEEYVWNFEVPETGNTGIIRLTLFLCDELAPFEATDEFIIDFQPNPNDNYIKNLTSVTFRVNDELDIASTFSNFLIYADNGDKNGVLDPEDQPVTGTSYSIDPVFSSVTITIPNGNAPIPVNDSYGNAGDDYFVVIMTADIQCGPCGLDEKFSFTMDMDSLQFDAGDPNPAIFPVNGPKGCSPVNTDAITCEALAIDLLPIKQGPPYDCIALGKETYPGNERDLLDNGRSRFVPRYRYYIPDATIRMKYHGEYELLSGITVDSFDLIPLEKKTCSALADNCDALNCDKLPEYFRIPEVSPVERRFGVIGIDVAGGTSDNPEYLKSIKLTLTNTFGDYEFDPRDHLDRVLSAYPYFSGLAVYEDTNNNGQWDEVSYGDDFQPISGTGDLPLHFSSSVFTVNDYTTFEITLNLYNPPFSYPIELLADHQPDYFIVERADSGLSDDSLFVRDGKGINQGANFRSELLGGSVEFLNAAPFGGIQTTVVKPSYSMLSAQDYCIYFGDGPLSSTEPLVGSIGQTIDALSSPTPILAFNAACSDVPQTGLDDDPIKFQSIKLTFDSTFLDPNTGIERPTGFDPGDIAEFFIFRDDKSPFFDDNPYQAPLFAGRNIGVFDIMNDMANWMPPDSPYDARTNPSEESPISLSPYAIGDANGDGVYEVVLTPLTGMKFYPRDKIETQYSIDYPFDNYSWTYPEQLPENTVFAGSDYFIAIKTSDKIAYRDIIRPRIPIGGVVTSTGPTVLKDEDLIDPEDEDGKVRELIANVPVILQDLTSAKDPLGNGLNPLLRENEANVEVIGINTFTNSPVGGEEVYFEQLIVQFIEAASRLSPNFNLGENGDLLPYQDENGDNTVYSGIKVWRVIDGVRYLVKFAETDHSPYTFLDNPSLVASADAQNQAILMVFNPDDTSSLGGAPYTVQDLLRIPENDEGAYAGNDFIITISTSANFDLRQDNFSAAIISFGPETPGIPNPDVVLNGGVSIPPAFQFASSSALLYHQLYPEGIRGIGFRDSAGRHSRSFKSINTSAFNASRATRLKRVTNFQATVNDPQIHERTHEVLLTWDDTNADGPGTFNETGYWIESDMFGSYWPLPQNPLPPDTHSLLFRGPRFLVGRTVNFRIFAFQEGLDPMAKYPPMNGIGPVEVTSITFPDSLNPPPPTCIFSYSFDPDTYDGCAPEVVQFTDESLDAPTSWNWDFGDGSDPSLQQNPLHPYTGGGPFTVTLTVCNEGGCDTSYEIITGISDVPEPDFVSDKDEMCVGDSICFTDQSTNSPASWAWDFGDGASSTDQNPCHMYSAPGTYTVRLYVGNACGDSDPVFKEQTIVVHAGIVADFEADIVEGCAPLTVSFTNTSLCEPTECLWDFGDGKTSTNCNPTHLYTVPGTYSVSLTIEKGGEVSDITKPDYITVGAVAADFEITTVQGCGVETIHFTDTSLCNPTEWSWDFGDSSVSTEQNPSHTYTSCGTYDVTLTASNSFSSDVISKPGAVTITKVPGAAFSSDAIAVCAGQPVQFFDQSDCAPVQWLWDFGDGATSAVQNPPHAYAAAGQYTVSLTVRNDCGSISEVKSNYVTVKEIPVADFTVDVTEGCIPLVVQLTDLSTAAESWEWDFGGIIPPVIGEQNPTLLLTEAGVYDVSLTVTNPCGTDTASRSSYIVVSAGLTADFTAVVREGCLPLTVQFENTSTCSPTTSSWDFGDGSSSTEENPSHVYTTPGTFTVSLTVSKGADSDTETKPAFVIVEPVVADFEIATVQGCGVQTIQFTDTSLCSPTFWSWDFGDGTPLSAEQNPAHTYSGCGTYDVTLTAGKEGSSDNITKAAAVVITKIPTAAFSVDSTTVCVGTLVHFTDESTCEPASWLWDFGDGSTSTEANPSHAYEGAGQFTVSLTVTNACGSQIVAQTVQITVNEAPRAEFSADVLEGCVPLTVHFTDLSAPVPASWEWDFGDGVGSALQNPTHIYADAGVYAVSLTATNECGSTTEVKSGYIVVRPLVTAEFDYGSTNVCSGTSVPFYSLAGGSPTSCQWNFGDGSPVSEECEPLHEYAASGDYTVTLTVSNGCSTASVSHVVPVMVFTEIQPDFTFTGAGGCAPLEVCFIDASSGEVTDLLWDFGDGTSSGGFTPCHTFTEPGIYSVSLYVSNPCGEKSVSKEVVVYGEPRADFNANVTEGEVPLTVCFSDVSVGGNIVQWLWQFGDGGRSSERNPCHTYTKAGNYSVTLTVVSPCGNNTFTAANPIRVYDKITLLEPSDGAYLSAPPTFRWSGSVNNRFRVEYSFDPEFRTILASTPLLTATAFLCPGPVWANAPVYKKIYWRVRGANVEVEPLEIHESQVWTFWKY